MSRILIVEDDAEMASLLAGTLSECGYECDSAPNGTAALMKLQGADLLLVDVMMPMLNGFGLVQKMREQGNRTPVIFLTARDSTKDIVRGLEVGGDDYLIKPFKLEELLARIMAALRRARDTSQHLTWNDLSLDCSKRAATRSGHELYLSTTEFALLELLTRHPETVFSKSVILREVWKDEGYRGDNIVEVYINYLRKKTEAHGASRIVQTARGRGYLLSVTEYDA